MHQRGFVNMTGH